MAETNTFLTRIQLRHDTATNWTANNPVLAEGEVGVEFSTIEGSTTPIIKIKIGDGTTAWNDLAYYGDSKGNADVALTEVTPADGQTDLAAINAAITDPKTGNYAVVKRVINGDKVELTAYVYVNDAWYALDGNYNAENVYFANDLLTTTAIGNITLTNGQATIPAAGKNLKEVFNTIFVEAKDPTVTQPSVSVALTNAGAKEVGTNFTPAYSVTFNKGKYEYGPDTGITATYAVTDTNSNSATTATGSFAQFQVTESTNYKVSVTATYSAGAIPVNNIGDEVANKQINAGSKSATSSAVTGYRAWFYGYKNASQVIADPTALTSAQVRALTAINGSFPATITTNQMQQMFFCAPAGVVKSVTVTNSTNGAPQTVKKATAQVEGANSYTAAEYDVYYVSNATAESGSTTFKIAITK